MDILSGIGTIGSAIGSAITGGLNYRAQKEANRLNYQMFQEANQFNAEQAQINRDWQLDMWNKTNEYNSPTAWRDRMTDAGFNPWNYDGGANASAASGAQASSASAPTMVAPQLDSNMFGAIGTALMQLAQIKKINAETLGLQIANSWTPTFNQQTYSLGNANLRYLGLNNDFLEQTMDSRKQQIALQNELTTQQKLLVEAETICKQLQWSADATALKYLDKRYQLELVNSSLQAFESFARGRLTLKQFDKVVSDIALQSIQAAGMQLNNDILRSTKDSLIKSLNSNYEWTFRWNNRKKQDFEKWYSRALLRDDYQTSIMHYNLLNSGEQYQFFRDSKDFNLRKLENDAEGSWLNNLNTSIGIVKGIQDLF